MTGNILWLFEISQIFVVGDDGYWIFGSGKVMLPFLECLDNSKEFSVIDVIIPFS